MSIQAEFVTEETAMESCRVLATLRDGDGAVLPWGDIEPRTVTFTNGVSEAVWFTAPRIAERVGVYDAVLSSQASSCV
jgi:hypothetical protein